MRFRLVQELPTDGFPVAVACRVLQVSRSGFYDWAGRRPSARDVADAYLVEEIRAIHADSRQTYGVRRVHAELRLGRDVRCGRQRVERPSTTSSSARSALRRRTGCGSPTSPSTALARVGSTPRQWSTST